MSEVTLPAWLFALMAVLSAWALVARILVPALRGALRWRDRRVLREVRGRLSIPIEPFRLSRRRVLVDALLADPQVMAAAEERARAEGIPREAVMARVATYAREIVPAFSAYVYFRIGYALARGLARMLYRVRLGRSDEAALAAIPRGSTVVFVMNHRSNMDYILAAFLAAERTALSYAVGEWARIFPIEQLIRATGAFFVRRDSKDPLYRKVLERYVGMATAAGVPQAVFPEGGLSRDGRLRPPRLGLIDYMVRSFDPAGERDIVFVPAGINYDRVLEDRTLLLDLDRTAPKKRGLAALQTTLGFIGHNLWLAVRSEWRKLGYACVSFGPPRSLRAFLASSAERHADPRRLPKEERFALVSELAKELMGAIALAVPVLPVSLVATVFAREGTRGLSLLELKGEVLDLTERLWERGAYIHVPRSDQDYAVNVGLRMLTLRRVVAETEPGVFSARPEEAALLRYYAGSIAHLLPELTH